MHRIQPRRLLGVFFTIATVVVPALAGATPANAVNPLIGSAHGGNTFPGPVMPFGMFAWSPETTEGNHVRTPAPGGYAFDATRIRGFSLTHLSGTGCAGASGDIPFMPVTRRIESSPSADAKDAIYASDFEHRHETARTGFYGVALANGTRVNLTAALHSGLGEFVFPAKKPARLLIRSSDSEVGSAAAHTDIDVGSHTVTGAVTSGNFCGYLAKADQKSYYTLYFVARFDQPFTSHGTWHDATVDRGGTRSQGGTTYGKDGWPPAGKGSGGWVGFRAGTDVHVRIGISYVSLANAKANLAAEISASDTLADVRKDNRAAWNKALGHIDIDGGSVNRRTTFYTALYHVLLHPNVFSDVNGEYAGFDGHVHHVKASQRAQYANFSGWDIYRSHLPLVTWLFPDTASDIAQSLYNQARQNHGEWDRWTHNAGGTHVMAGDPAAPGLADIVAFGGRDFDVAGAYRSLKHAATHVSAHDRSDAGCNVECVGQRPSLDDWMTRHYIPTHAHAWGGAGETLEDATADFALSQLADAAGDHAGHRLFLERSGYWRHLFNPDATPTGGYIQNRNADGSWPAFELQTGDGFVEGSAAVYLWMVPFDVDGLFDALGGRARAAERLDDFFHTADGQWALTDAGPLHAELNNEPSIGTPWLYAWAGQPWKTQKAVRIVENQIWHNAPDGIPGNDDLGAMSAWYVWAAMGLYPAIPGRAELIVGSPLFARIHITRPGGDITITANSTDPADRPYVQQLRWDSQALDRPWLPARFVDHGGRLEFDLDVQPNKNWGAAPAAAPPSFSLPR